MMALVPVLICPYLLKKSITMLVLVKRHKGDRGERGGGEERKRERDRERKRERKREIMNITKSLQPLPPPV